MNHPTKKALKIQKFCTNRCKDNSKQYTDRNQCYRYCVEYKYTWDDFWKCYNRRHGSQRNQCMPNFFGADDNIPISLEYGDYPQNVQS